ncbi:hypothetical protein AB0M94_38870 [Streptomyces xanthochromogenes]|uniref:hypothetical protein n=1 Tax=Streptomyces xanthochromogenes TaxID=67384 RepID=UPI003416B348
MSGIPTPSEFLAAHGDPKGWVSAEFDEWETTCDRVRLTRRRLNEVADWIAAHPKATRAELVAVIEGGAR